MANKNKIKQLIEKLSQFESNLPMEDDMRSLADGILNREFERISKQVKRDTTTKYLDDLNRKLETLRKDLDLTPFSEQLNQVENDLISLREAIINDLETVGKTFTEKQNELSGLIDLTKNELSSATNQEIKNLLSKIARLEEEFTYQAEESSLTGQSLKEALSAFEKRINLINDEFNRADRERTSANLAFNTRLEDALGSTQNSFKEIEKLRTEFISKLANIGGGNANRRIDVGSSVISTKYTDINLKAGTGVTLTKSDNNTSKQVDLTISSSGESISSILTSTGDLLTANPGGTLARVGIGGANTVVHGGTIPTYSAVVEADISLSNNTTNNATTLRHGFLPILSGNPLQFLDGNGNYSTPTAGVANSYSSTTFTSQTSVNVIHNFGTYPIVQVIDNTGKMLIPLNVTHNTLNDFTVTFSLSTSGTIVASVGSPQPQAVTVANDSYVVLTTDRIVKMTAAAKTVTLPTAAGNTGREFVLNNASTGDMTVATSSVQTINGVTTQTVPSRSTMVVYSDGSNYQII